jgi:hypothetical protein
MKCPRLPAKTSLGANIRNVRQGSCHPHVFYSPFGLRWHLSGAERDAPIPNGRPLGQSYHSRLRVLYLGLTLTPPREKLP